MSLYFSDGVEVNHLQPSDHFLAQKNDLHLFETHTTQKSNIHRYQNMSILSYFEKGKDRLPVPPFFQGNIHSFVFRGGINKNQPAVVESKQPGTLSERFLQSHEQRLLGFFQAHGSMESMSGFYLHHGLWEQRYPLGSPRNLRKCWDER